MAFLNNFNSQKLKLSMKVLILVVIITSCQDKTPSFIQEKFKEFPQSQKGETLSLIHI